MFTESEVFCSTVPVCSAMLMNSAPNSSSITGSGFDASASTAFARASTRRRIMWFSAVTSACQPGSTTVVAFASRISAGPRTVSPASSASRSSTGARCSRPPVQSATPSITGTASPAGRAASLGSSTVSPAAIASAMQASTITARSGEAKPKRRRCASVKLASTASWSPNSTGRKASVPA